MHLSDFPVLFKADLIFKDFSGKPSKCKYISSLCEPWDQTVWKPNLVGTIVVSTQQSRGSLKLPPILELLIPPLTNLAQRMS